MHLLIYTRKRARPLIFKLYGIVIVLLAVLALGLIILPVRLNLNVRASRAELRELEALKAQAAEKILEADKRIAELEERISRIEPAPAGSGLLLEALSKNFANAPWDTVIPLRPMEKKPPGGENAYAIQIFATRNRNAAAALAADFRSTLGLDIEIIEAELPSGHWYKVVATGFASSGQARTYARRLVTSGKIKDYIIHRLSPPDSAGN
ncbi:MAG: SPOR domain-containing protein [Gemmatimonadota bacterium]|nr:SPOR domain-containing protein [Gemmatimonadota bacterium]